MKTWIRLAGLIYWVDSCGTIEKRQGNGNLKLRPNVDGYACVVIRPTRKVGVYYTAHKVIWEAFNGPVPEGYEIDHIDNDRMNCSLSNLQLLTHAENVEKAHARIYKLLNPEDEVVEIYNLSKFCREVGLDQGSMSKVISGKRLIHKGWRLYND